jgi:trans-aconitate methyltransferase
MVKIYNKDQGIGYAPLPKISPYSKIEKSRLANPKLTFRFASQLVKKKSKLDANFTLPDLGCANGEFLYFLRDEFPQAVLHGLDITPKFI